MAVLNPSPQYTIGRRLTLLCNGMASHCISTLKISTSNDVSLMSIYGAGVEDATTTSSRLMNETANEINFFTFPSLAVLY